MNKQYADIDGHRIAYYRQGEGQPMLLVHGITTWSFVWRNLIPSFARHYDVIAVDLLGCGESDKPAHEDYSIAAQAGMLRKLCDALNLERINLVCHDIGGGVGQIFTVREPARVRTLTLINSVAFDFWPVQPIITMRIPIIRQLAMAALDLGVLRMLVSRGVYHKERVTGELMELFWQPLRQREGRQGFLQLAKCLNNANLMFIAPALKELTTPVLIIRGDADPYLGPEIAEALHEHIRNSRYERIATGGHFIMEDEPDLLSRIILEFVAQYRNAQPSAANEKNHHLR